MDIRTLLQAAECSTDNLPFSNHFHNSYELLFIREGMKELSVTDHKYLLCPGSLTIISCLEPHSTELIGNKCSGAYILISPNFLDTIISNSTLSSIFRNHPSKFTHVFDMSEDIDFLGRCFENIVSEYKDPHEYSGLMLTSFLNAILIYTYRKYPDSFFSISNTISKEITFVQKYIEENFQEELRIADIAEQHYINPYYLTRCFKEQTGYSPKQYLTNIRLAHAREALLQTTLPIKEIAYQSGFSDVNNFIRTFKKYTNTTPYKYRSGK